jgi:cytosine deaminase
MLLRNVTLADGTRTSVRVCTDVVDAVSDGLTAQPGEVVDDLEGWLVLPAAVEPHAHLDKAFLAERVVNRTGDLMGAIRAVDEIDAALTIDDVVDRSRRAALLLASNGVTAIRSHADMHGPSGTRSVAALLRVRELVADVVDLQVCPLLGWPTIGAAGARVRDLAREAVAMGADIIGCCPHLEEDPEEATDVILELAGELGVAIDLHSDETLDPHVLAVEYLAERVVATGFEYAVTASHCVSLGVQPEAVQRRVADKLAVAGVSVIALPQTNLFLQGRDHQAAMPRGVTAVRALREAGVVVAAGGDNLQDPFNPLGRGDPCETAGLMIATAHLLPDDAWASVSTEARRVLGLPRADVQPGARADLVAVAAGTVREAIAFGPSQRRTMRAGSWIDAAADNSYSRHSAVAGHD